PAEPLGEQTAAAREKTPGCRLDPRLAKHRPPRRAVQRGGRRHGWGLPAAAALHGASWWAVLRLAGVEATPLGLLTGGSLLLALWLGWFQIYSVLRRGFSLQLMVELESGPLSLAELGEAYAGGRGLGWLLAKRVDGLDALGLARKERDALCLTPRGLAVARIAGLYKNLFGIGAGG
ncbi:MAG: hypothetical protein AAF725_20535, partial [Acidobacteriota bacterium]